MVGLQTLDLAIGVRVPASQPTYQVSKASGRGSRRRGDHLEQIFDFFD